MEYVSYLVLGAFAGVIAGLLGVGGGLVIVPLLLIIFDSYQIVPTQWMAHVAVATSLVTIIFTSFSAIRAQQQRQAIDWSLFSKLVPGVLLGSIFGSYLIGYLSKYFLLLFYICFLLLVSAKMWWQWSPAKENYQGHVKPIELFSVSGIIGIVSSLLGIGGGTMTVPYLSIRGVAIHKAIAVSTTLGLPIAVAGSIGFSLFFLQLELGDKFIGLVYWPAFLLISCMTLLTAPIGVALLHKLDKRRVTKIFALFLLLQALMTIEKVI